MTQNAEQPDAHMTRALALAARGRGWVEPNPMVGCVLVRDGEVIAEGYHQRFGGPHAEVAALRSGAETASGGATAYVTLEPCCHHGKTSPCTQALIAAGVARVVVAMIDPDPRVAGRGIAALAAAGVEVSVGMGRREARQLNAPFIKRMTTGMPWVTAKWAQTLDGKTATATGHSRWISNDPSRRMVHELRGMADAIVVGIGTALADDPALTARGVEVRRVARRVVVDPRLRLPPNAKLLTDAGPPVLIATSQANAEDSQARAALPDHVELLGLAALPDGRLDLTALLKHLTDQHDATHVLVEGGAGLVSSLLDQRLIDRAVVFLAPLLLGDPAARSSHEAPPAAARDKITDALRLKLTEVRRLGDDVMLDYHLRGKG